MFGQIYHLVLHPYAALMSVLATHILVGTVLLKHLLMYLLSQMYSCAIYIAIEAL